MTKVYAAKSGGFTNESFLKAKHFLMPESIFYNQSQLLDYVSNPRNSVVVKQLMADFMKLPATFTLQQLKNESLEIVKQIIQQAV